MMALYAALAPFASELKGSRIKIRGTFFKGVYRGYIGIMEKKMETTIEGLGFPKIRGTFLEVPIIRIGILWGLYWGPLFREITIFLPRLKKCNCVPVPQLITTITCLGLVPDGVCPKRP